MRKIYFRVLLAVAIFSEKQKFQNVQKLVRYLYCTFVIYLINGSLNFFLGEPVEVVARHSSQSGKHFNFALSDLDLSVFLENPEPLLLDKIRRSISLWKAFCPFIGEFEVYSFDEKKKLDKVLITAEPFFLMLRKVRKIQWMEIAYGNSQFDYHRYKALRAIQHCLNDVAPGEQACPSGNLLRVSPYLEQWIQKEMNRVNVRPELLTRVEGKAVPSYYMGGTVGLGALVRNDTEYTLSSKAGLLLLSMIPNGTSRDSELIEAIDEIRADAFLRRIWIALCEMELIIVVAVTRASKDEMPWVKTALMCLNESMSQANAQ